jgi:hypothetical protein
LSDLRGCGNADEWEGWELRMVTTTRRRRRREEYRDEGGK